MPNNGPVAPLWLVAAIAGVATLPLLISAALAIGAFPRFPLSGFFVFLMCDTNAVAQFSRIATYVGICVSTFLGAAYAPQLRALLSFQHPKRLLAFLAVFAVFVIAHLTLVYRLQDDVVRTNLLNQFPPDMVGHETEGIGQLLQYAQWVSGSWLTLAALVLGLPALTQGGGGGQNQAGEQNGSH